MGTPARRDAAELFRESIDDATTATAFYRALLRRTPRLWWDSMVRVEGTAAVLATVVLAFNQEIGQKLLSWDGFSPFWALLPIGLLFLLSLLRANFEAFASVRRERDDFKVKAATRIQRAKRENALGRQMRKFLDFSARVSPTTVEGRDALQADLMALVDETEDIIKAHFTPIDLELFADMSEPVSPTRGGDTETVGTFVMAGTLHRNLRRLVDRYPVND